MLKNIFNFFLGFSLPSSCPSACTFLFWHKPASGMCWNLFLEGIAVSTATSAGHGQGQGASEGMTASPIESHIGRGQPETRG